MILRARWVLPIERPPVENGWIGLEGGVITALGNGRPPAGQVTDVGDCAILPGLVNSHTHLELSWMAGRGAPARSMGEWISTLMALRRGAAPSVDAQTAAAAEALSHARAQGTLAFGDIGNTLVTAQVLAAARSPSVLFHELLGFLPHDADARAAEGADRIQSSVRPPVGAGLSAHAPYSVSTGLFRAVARETAARGLASSVHLGESAEEVEFLMTGRGEIAETLKALGAWDENWTAPRLDPVAYLDGIGALWRGLLVVHATQLKPPSLAILAERGCVIVSCPRSNRWVGAGDPPLDAFYGSGAVVAFGTDSLASAPNLDMFGELAAARAVSTVPPHRLLESATRGGAVALGLDDHYGRISAGLRGPLLAVRVPGGVADVQEYLVGGDVKELAWVG